MEYDEEAFETALKGLACFDEETAKEPENARLSDYSKENGYTIVPEKEGTLADYELVEKEVSEAILKLETNISLEELGADWNLCGISFSVLFLSCGESGSREKNGRDCKLCQSAVFHLHPL